VTGLEELYQEIILDHYRHPRGAADLSHVPATVHENPACGDSIRLEAVLDGDRLARVRFDAKGCAISTASASIMTERVAGLALEDARELARAFIRAVRGEGPPEVLDAAVELGAFRGVMKFPVRVKCATLPWHALLLTLAGAGTA
jgi:nitrogen fixation NifU-like protein